MDERDKWLIIGWIFGIISGYLLGYTYGALHILQTYRLI